MNQNVSEAFVRGLKRGERFASGHDSHVLRATRAISASKNPHHPCPKCGATVRLGGNGGLYDVRRRTAHFRVCGPQPKPDSIRLETLRAQSKLAPVPLGSFGCCIDCGFRDEHCRC